MKNLNDMINGLKDIIYVMLAAILLITFAVFNSCEKKVPEVPVAQVKFKLDKFIEPITIPFGRVFDNPQSMFIEEAQEITWNHVFTNDTFDIAFNPGKIQGWGTYSDFNNLSLAVPYGTYVQVALFPRHDEPQKSAGLWYYASAENVTVDSPEVTIELKAGTNQGLMLLNPSNVWWTSEELYSSQGYSYFYPMDSFNFDFKSIDDSTLYTFKIDHVVPGTIYYGEAPIKGQSTVFVNFDSLFTREEVTVFD